MTINALFDYNKNELVWTNASKKGKNYFNFIDNKIFLNTKDGSGLWDIKTRQFAWKINSPLAYSHGFLKISLLDFCLIFFTLLSFLAISLKAFSVSLLPEKSSVTTHSQSTFVCKILW
jgi:hypothetical protein